MPNITKVPFTAYTIGDPIFLRYEDFHNQQLFLPFTQGHLLLDSSEFNYYVEELYKEREKKYWTEFKKVTPPKEKKKSRKKDKIKDYERIVYVKDNKHLIIYETDQLILPFKEWQAVDYNLASMEPTMLKMTKWAGWGDNTGKPYKFSVKFPNILHTEDEIKQLIDQINTWCIDQFKGRYRILWRSNNMGYPKTITVSLLIEKGLDAVKFKLRWM